MIFINWQQLYEDGLIDKPFLLGDPENYQGDKTEDEGDNDNE